MRRLRASFARLSAVAMLASLLALVGNSPAQADAVPATNWTPVTIGSDLPAASTVLTDAAGGVTVGCQNGGTYATSFKSFSSAGSAVQTVSYGNPGGMFCTGSGTVGKDGTAYVGVTSSNGYTQYIQAWKNNSLVWQYQIPCGSNGQPWTMTMGANGNLYAVIWQGGGSCSSNQLIGLTPTAQTGSNPPVPQVVMNMSLGTSIRGGGAAAYDDGLVFFTSTNSILYVPYSATSAGTPIATSNVNYPWAGGSWFEATPDGKVYLPVKATSSQTVSCTNPNSRTGSILTVNPNGTTTSSTLGGCVTVHEMHPFPSGGVAMRYAYSDSTTAWTDVEKVSTPGWSKQVGDPDLMTRVSMAVDLNGNIAMRNNATPIHNGRVHPEITFTLMSGVTGEFITSAAFALRGEHDTTDGPSYRWAGDGDIAIAKNTVYVTAYQCNYWNVGCPTSSTKLYAFTVPGLQMDYPRGAILKHDEPWKDYVGMGDSFSSGQGVTPYESGTDTAGPPENRCRRSGQAYAKLLDDNLGSRLNLTNFVACGGSETSHVINGRYGEAPQVNALSTNTKVVTLTVGGNDIGFEPLVTACVTDNDCTQSTAYSNAVDVLQNDLPDRLDGLFQDIEGRLSSGARVLVIGYPLLIPDASAATSWPSCVYLTSTEKTAARDLIGNLNQALYDAAVRAGTPFEYLEPNGPGSPFEGHELCNDGSYFNGAVPPPGDTSLSYHPNAKGQDAYRQLIQQHLGS
ncbi:SGNH/GDSL hydrolase family protein [Streptomyces lunaelactis]|uniref:SGNH/GDSL hydrolase family protein n=1 Tax=Streptomyces lunaelactis TaxID=1535768 RepID=UPI001584E342|nr:SGNH/GDSL hydrolase family protein [Streptomyces lunaelactis]NUL28436.1 SGNH/GDSL hydrolase family protein [Streptomyces lunaelactis]